MFEYRGGQTMKQNNFHKKHINKWLIFVLCMAFTLQLFAVPMLALAENMENAPGQETPAAGEVLSLIHIFVKAQTQLRMTALEF